VGGKRHAPAALTPRKGTGTHFRGGWMGPSTGLDGYGEEKIPCPTGVQAPFVQPSASLCTEYVIPVALDLIYYVNNLHCSCCKGNNPARESVNNNGQLHTALR
jgi:hypothetical protein